MIWALIAGIIPPLCEAVKVTVILLGSSSPYRRELFARLRLPFEHASPDIDETPREGETPAQLVLRLATAKAHALAPGHDGDAIVAADQVATIDGRILGKPGSAEATCEQLSLMSGRDVRFLTSVCVLTSERIVGHVDLTRVAFRQLSAEEIDRYVAAEQPFDCAGGFKCEGLGISLFDAVETRDPTALIGLPLIATCRLLRAVDINVP